jgi:hypothetical protein
MRYIAFFTFLLGLASGFSPAQTQVLNSPSGNTNAAPPLTAFEPPNDPGADARARVPGLYQAWKAERDPAKRADLAGQLLDAIIHCYVNQPIDIADEIARDGLPKHDLLPPTNSTNVTLKEVMTLSGIHPNPWGEFPISPVFRRISDKRLEAWTSNEGWLFDAKGKLLVHVTVPRRDGGGREWFGAFLSEGNWITTDIWTEDKQINAYNAKGEWRWELAGTHILSRLSPATSTDDSDYKWRLPLIDWARADWKGNGWLVSVGANGSSSFALVNEKGAVKALPTGASLWGLVYPRAMGVRGMYSSLYIDSDDGKVTLNRGEAPHGVYVGWPNYDLSNKWGVIIPEGNDQFGFWPYSHDIYIEGQQSVPEAWHLPNRVWFFSAEGKYQGEVIGSRLGDAANGRDLLIQDANDQVVQVESKATGLAICDVRRFTWPDGTTAVPLAVYDDLHLGFFLRGPGMTGFTDDARRARACAEVVLAKWKD